MMKKLFIIFAFSFLWMNSYSQFNPWFFVGESAKPLIDSVLVFQICNSNAANVPSVSYCAGTDIPVLNLMPDETITLSDLVAEGFLGASEGVIDKVVDGATVMN